MIDFYLSFRLLDKPSRHSFSLFRLFFFNKQGVGKRLFFPFVIPAAFAILVLLCFCLKHPRSPFSSDFLASRFLSSAANGFIVLQVSEESAEAWVDEFTTTGPDFHQAKAAVEVSQTFLSPNPKLLSDTQEI